MIGHLSNLSTWLFLPFGILVAWSLQGQERELSALVIVLYGFCTTFLGCFLAIAHMTPNQSKKDDALEVLRDRYERALKHQIGNTRDALMFLTRRALNKAARKMVSELLPNNENDEQMDAAVKCATIIVENELKEIAKMVGASEEVARDCD